MFEKKSQGEIFGIALMFVIIIIGILVYTQIQALNPDRDSDNLQGEEYQILAQTSLESVLKRSTGCYVERGRDKVSDLINACLDRTFSGIDPTIECGVGDSTFEIKACTYSVNVINQTLFSLFNSTLVGPLLFEMEIDIPKNSRSRLHNITLTNFGTYTYRGEIINESNYRKNSFKKAPSGLKTWSTSQTNIEFQLNIYYK